jgi:hypothetical protein
MQIIKVIAIVIFSSLFFMGWKACLKEDHLKSVELIFSYPLSIYKEKNGIRVYSLNDTLLISYHNDYILYRLSPTIEFKTGKKISGTEPYFIFKKRNSNGFLFSSLKDISSGVKYSVDSILSTRGMKGTDFDTPPDSLWHLVDTISDDRKTFFLEKYAATKIIDETTIDSIYYYYAKNLKKVEYSFSKKLDSLRNSKLYKIELIFNKKFSSSYNGTLPRREFLFELRDKNLQNKSEIISFFKKFEKQYND